ncbi:MFS transporter [Variovorax fucosicus]|uniref:MFS transporter n=1 Tax=Variovorax fucosicus TaxID=3053517 RepID=UPI0025752C2E|nr:MFS transporter [Variovorax sp. J22G47]MDM0059128.1 MFS transporter [Variovorax sp. J22G47]
MISTDSKRGRIALSVAHCAGMLDMVALPVWVGTLVANYRFDPQQAGLLATLFLVGAVLTSLLLASRFHRLPRRAAVTLSFLASAIGFGVAALASDFKTLAGLHLLCGMATGAALSVTHGTVALSANPHRLFAIVNMALGVVAIFYLGVTPRLVAQWGGAALFGVFSAAMALAALVCLFNFPHAVAAPSVAPGAVKAARLAAVSGPARFSAAVWFGIVGVALVALVQAMTTSFVERAGIDRGFGPQAVAGVLIALGVVNLVPAPLAVLLERRLPARGVLLCAPLIQAALAVAVMNATGFPIYAGSTAVFVAVIIFSHTFAFGLLARLEQTGRALAATPAMLMIGAAIGPVLGGTLVKFHGYDAIGVAAVVLAACACWCFSRLPVQAAPATPAFPA